jgi:hypothetical protein
MAEAKAPKAVKGKKVTTNVENVNVCKGLKKEPAAKGEVTGHISPGKYYLCFHDRAINWVRRGWSYFICWRCHAFNRC